MLDNLLDIINGLKNFDTTKEVNSIVEANKDTITELQKEQMLEGRGADGQFIRPFYSEDPYFKSAASAARYAEWKSKITPNEKRPKDVPNLFIDGTFHSSLFTKIGGGVFSIETKSFVGEKIFEEHPNAAGLDEENRKEFATKVTLPEFGKVLEQKTTIRI